MNLPIRHWNAHSALALVGALVWGAVEVVALARSRRVLKAGADHA